MTVTISSLVEAMLDSYANVTQGLQGFSWREDPRTTVEEFIFTRNCFFYSRNRAPLLEATFTVLHYRADELDIDLHFTWNPPFVGFQDLCNVVTEGNEFHLRPTIDPRRPTRNLPVTAEYYVGPGDGWLNWDEEKECFRGTVPPKIASQIGAERFEVYTVPLELTARITKHFPGTIRFERIFRCVLPLTVKRRPDNCANEPEKIISPPVARPTASRMTRPPVMPHASQRPERTPASPLSPRSGNLARPPLVRSPLRRTHARAHLPESYPRVRMLSTSEKENKENNDLGMGDICKVLERKAQSPIPEWPMRLNSLTLARLHDAVCLSNPPSSLTEPEVRTVHQIECNSPKENAAPLARPNTPNATRSMPFRAKHGNTFGEVDLGRTHLNRYGKLASRSGSQEGLDSPSWASPSTRNITPVALSPVVNLSQRRNGKRPFRSEDSPSKAAKIPVLSPTKAEGERKLADAKNPETPREDSMNASDICYTCLLQGRNPKVPKKDSNGLFIDCLEATAHQCLDNIFANGSDEDKMALWGAFFAASDISGIQHLVGGLRNDHQHLQENDIVAKEASVKEAIDKWQEKIQKNFEEFEGKPAEKLDVTMETVVESDEEMPSFQSDM